MSRLVPIRSRQERISLLADRRIALTLLVLMLLLMVSFVLGASLGSKWESPWQVLLTLVGQGEIQLL